jgi:hypothetical protein
MATKSTECAKEYVNNFELFVLYVTIKLFTGSIKVIRTPIRE